MVSAATDDSPQVYYGPLEETTMPTSATSITEEFMALADFAQRLGTINCTNDDDESGIVETRQEAELLMKIAAIRSNSNNVSSSSSAAPPPPSHLSDTTSTTVSSSSSSSVDSPASTAAATAAAAAAAAVDRQQHTSSAAPPPQQQQRDMFSFTCPSLSLENPEEKPFHMQANFQTSASLPHDESSSTVPPHSTPLSSSSFLRPLSELLGRPLKAEDRNALRLSADAMARNVLYSFQSALQWRIQVWMEHLTSILLKKEQQYALLKNDHDQEQQVVKELCDSPEAMVVLALRNLKDRITVQSTGTAFEVLNQKKVVVQEDQGPSIISRQESRSLKESGSSNNYEYTVGYDLQFRCNVRLLMTPPSTTPNTTAGAGGTFSEIAIAVPGTIFGSFSSCCPDNSDDTTTAVVNHLLRSVTVNVHTSMLSCMIEKSTRSIVRTVVEQTIREHHQAYNSAPSPFASSSAPQEHSEEEQQQATTKTTTTMDDAILLASPPAYSNTPHDPAAWVTPSTLYVDSSGTSTEGPNKKTPSSKVLLPIPDDLNNNNDDVHFRRISPQSFGSTGGGTPPPAFGPRNNKRRLSFGGGEQQQHDPQDASLSTTAIAATTTTTTTTTPSSSNKQQRRCMPPLISPVARKNTKDNKEEDNVQYCDVSDNGGGPSLPMLVEAACRAMKVD